MASSHLHKRLQDLEDHVVQDLKLLKNYEDALRLEDDPRRQAKYGWEIDQIRCSATRYQEEANELRKQVLNEQTATMQILDERLDQIVSDLRLLKGGQIAILGRLDQSRQTLLNRYDVSQQRVIAVLTQQLNQSQLLMTQTLLDALEENQLTESEMNQMWALLEERMIALPPSQSSITEIVKDPQIDAKHKLKASVPIIPFILDYEGELELGTGFNIKTAWDKIKIMLQRE
jgi:hypothetical protein